jgi:hypothetical protein
VLNFDGCYALKTVSNIAALSAAGGTIYLHINENIDDSDWDSDEATILKFDNFRIYLGRFMTSVNLIIEHTGSTATGQWLGATLTNAQHQIAFSYDFSAGAPADPVLVIDGVTFIARVVAPSGAYAIGAQQAFIGGESVSAVTNPCKVPLGEVAIFVGTKLTETQMKQLTTSKTMRMPLQYSSCTHYWAMDEIADGEEYAAVGNQINPNGDVLTPWVSATPHYSKINAADGVYLQADPNDDSEVEIFDCTTDTIPANRKIGAFKVDVLGYQTSNPLAYVEIACNGSAGTQVLSLPTVAGWATALQFYVLGTQAQLDAMQLYLISGTLATDENIYIDQVKITPYYIWNRILDYKSGNYLVGISGALGVANNFLSYP